MAHELLDTLKKDHRLVRSLLNRLESSDKAPERKQLLSQIRQELMPHMEGEEASVYPPIRAQAQDDIQESLHEHSEAKEQLEILLDTNPSDKSFGEKVSQLKDMVEHHVEEEEDRIFSDLQQNKSQDELDRILSGFQDAKNKALDRLSTTH